MPRVSALSRLPIAVLVAAALVTGVTRAGADPTAVVQTTHVAAAPCAVTVPVPEDYTGLSLEWSMIQHWFGTSRAGVVPSAVSLLKSLHPGPGGGVLRIGGISQEHHRWDPAGTTADNTLFIGTITPGMIDALFEVARRSGWHVLVGLNIRVNRPDEAVALTRYIRLHDPSGSLLAVDMGNEPNNYFHEDVAGYVARVGTYIDALDADPVTRGVPVAGPSLSNQANLDYIRSLLAAYGSRVQLVTWHHYANRPTLKRLLEEQVATEWTDRIAQVDLAAGTTPTRMDEGNSVGGGGMNRVSNVTGTTAWLVDTLLSGAMTGLSGYNLHSWDEHYYPDAKYDARYTPFVIRDGRAEARSPFYALALLRELGGKRLCRAVAANNPDGGIKAWSATDPATGHVLVYLVNKSADVRPTTVTGATGAAVTSATLSRISDAAGCNGKGTGINGARLSASGTLSWRAARVSPGPTGSYDVQLQPCQAAVLDVTPSGLQPAHTGT